MEIQTDGEEDGQVATRVEETSELISLRAGDSVRTRLAEQTNLRIRNTTVVPRLGERLVLAVSVALRWSSSHFDLVDGVGDWREGGL